MRSVDEAVAICKRAREEAGRPAPKVKTAVDRHAVVIEAMFYMGGWSKAYGVGQQIQAAKTIGKMLADRDKRIAELEKTLAEVGAGLKASVESYR